MAVCRYLQYYKTHDKILQYGRIKEAEIQKTSK